MTHRAQEQVRAWHIAMGDEYPAPGTAPIAIGRNARLRFELLWEELQETAVAHRDGDLTEVIDGLCDLLFVLYGAADTWGIDLEPFFDEVVRSNMTKVGGPIREDGKRLKPDTFEPPRIREMLTELGDLTP